MSKTTDIVTAEPVNRPVLMRPIANPAELIEAHKAASDLIKEALEEGVDYGEIPGTNKPKTLRPGQRPEPKRNVLLKPGAERLCAAYGLKPIYEVIESEVDHNRPVPFETTKWVEQEKPDDATVEQMKAAGTGKFFKDDSGSRPKWIWKVASREQATFYGIYRFVVRCRLLNWEGAEVGQKIGIASSMETKWARNTRDSENTIMQIAQKRALVGAVLVTLGLSGRFTQDVEDFVEPSAPTQPPTDDNVIDAEVVETADSLTKGQLLTKFGITEKYPNQVEEFGTAYKATGLQSEAALRQAYEAGARTFKELIAYLDSQKPKSSQFGGS